MDVLITGTGLVGSNAASRFIDEGYTVTAFDIQHRKVDYLENAGSKLKLIQGDVSDLQSFESAVKQENPKTLVHTAIFPVSKDAHRLFDVNVRGAANAIEMARKYNLRLIYISSATIYGQLGGKGNIRENEPFGPAFPPRKQDSEWASAYCMSKRFSEKWAAMYQALFGLHVTCLRLGWVYGRGDIGGRIGPRMNAGVPLLLRKALAGQPLHLPYGGDTFSHFVNVRDVAEAIFKAATVPKLKSLAYNIAYEKGYWMKEVAKVIMQLVPGSDLKLGRGLWPSKGVPFPRGAISWPTNRHLDIARAKRELGYKPSYDLVKGVEEYAAWMKKNWDLCSPEVVPFPA